MSREPERIEFTQVGAAVYVSKFWPEVVLFADELLASGVNLLSVDGDTVTITVGNGRAQYRRVRAAAPDPVLKPSGVSLYERRSYTYTRMGDDHAT